MSTSDSNWHIVIVLTSDSNWLIVIVSTSDSNWHIVIVSTSDSNWHIVIVSTSDSNWHIVTVPTNDSNWHIVIVSSNNGNWHIDCVQYWLQQDMLSDLIQARHCCCGALGTMNLAGPHDNLALCVKGVYFIYNYLADYFYINCHIQGLIFIAGFLC